jgi:hypothetical protein
MGTKTREVGGGPAVGLGEDIIKFLQSGLTGGQFGGGATFGGNAMTHTQGIAGFLNDILSGGAGNLGGSMQQMISRDTDRNAAAMRARYSMGGTGFGTPAAYGEGVLRSESGPKMAQAVGGLQLQTILPLLQMMMQMGGKGISQRQMIAEPSPWASAASIAAPLIGAGMNLFAPNPFGGGANSGMLPFMPPPANSWMFNNLPGIS